MDLPSLPGTEHLSSRVHTVALAGEFVHLTDFVNTINVPDNDEIRTVVGIDGRISLKSSRARRVITTSYQWLEAWAVYELVICSCYGLCVFHQMVAYRLFIISLFQKYRLPYVVHYDSRHRQLLGARRSFAFNSLNHDLFVTTFDSGAVRASTTRCTRCGSVDHQVAACPFRPPGQSSELPGRRNDRGSDRTDSRGAERGGDRADRSGEICYLYQENKCKAGSKCSRKHACISCGGSDGLKSCKKCKGGRPDNA